MNPESRAQPPIGYWLKHTDEVITQHVNQVLIDHGLTRFHWQVLNIVYEADITTPAQVFETMQTFIDAAQLNAIIDEYVERGWMDRQLDDNSGVTRLALTAAGEEGHRTIFSLQSEVRKRAMAGISEAEYATVIRVLQRVVSNLE